MTFNDTSAPFFSYVGPTGALLVCMFLEGELAKTSGHRRFEVVHGMDEPTMGSHSPSARSLALDCHDGIGISDDAVIDVARTVHFLVEERAMTLVESESDVETCVLYPAYFETTCRENRQASIDALVAEAGECDDEGFEPDEDEHYERMTYPERIALDRAYARAA